MPLYVLNETEIEILKEVIADWRRRRIHTWTAPPDEVFGQASSVYVAWPPENGIPALTAVGDIGPDGGRDQPGSATCDIYRIDNLASTPDLQAVPDFSKVVYNLTESDIPRRWIVVQKTAYGQWVVGAGAEHQAKWIKFAATEDFTSGEANVTVDGVTSYDGYAPDPTPTSVENPGWAGLDNDLGLAFLNEDDGKYYIASMITVATDIMVGHRIDDSNNKKFETLWQEFYMRPAETTTSDWRTDHTGADCP